MGIQDAVEVTLMKNSHHDVARDYIIYRDNRKIKREVNTQGLKISHPNTCLLYTSPSPRDRTRSRMPSSA